MRPPTPTERNLLVLLLAAVFLAINIAGLRFWLAFNARQENARQTAAAAILEGRSWILGAESIDAVGDVMASPPASEAKTASSSLLTLAREKAGEHGLTILEEALPTAPENLPEPAAVLRIKVNGPFVGLVRFLFAIQEPGAWRSVDQMVVKADPKPQNILAELEVRQYYSEMGSGAARGENPGVPPPEN